MPLVILETREHLDLDELPAALAAELGPMIVRLERAIRSTGDIARVHIHRWGDGSAHFHLWFFGRPNGALHLLGMGTTMWSEVLPAMARDEWDECMRKIAQDLARDGGHALL